MATKKNGKTSKPTKQPKKTEALCYVYGGALKSKHTRFFVADYKDKNGIVEFVKNNFVQYYGSVLSGRYIPCEDGEKALAQVVQLAKSEKYDLDGYIITASVGNATALLKKATSEETAHTFTIDDRPNNEEEPEDEPDEEQEEKPVPKPSGRKQNKETKTTTQKTNASKSSPKKQPDEDLDDDLAADECNDLDDDKNNEDDQPTHDNNGADDEEDNNDKEADEEVDEAEEVEEKVEKGKEVKKPPAKKGGIVAKPPAKKPAGAKTVADKSVKKPRGKTAR